MNDQFLAAMLAISIPGVFAVALTVDTNPFTARRFRTLGARLLDWYCSWPIWEKLDG